jgi:hypothetical protein
VTVILLELNEVNFGFVQAYAADGNLPTLARLIDRHGLQETESEARYEELEPWIQWVTAHTGLALAEHGVFRLGDIVGRPDIRQIWETLEQQEVSVAAMSPMNAVNRCTNANFFVPDPWTPAAVTGPAIVRRLYAAVANGVNDNAEGKLDAKSALDLLAGAAIYARPRNYSYYLALALQATRGAEWAKAMFLDLLLADSFTGLTKKYKPRFSSIFLNAAAHIQHHYMFNAAVYSGPHVNPEWYIDASADPVLAVYKLYDRIVAQIERRFPDARLMLATGLHQDPCTQPTYYWRLRDHAAFLSAAGVPFERVEPRMSRDFVIYARDAEQAAEAQVALDKITTTAGEPLFEVDNRGETLFAMFTWPNDIGEDMAFSIANEPRQALRSHVAFVAIKNGRHNGIGYFIDTGANCRTGHRFALTEIPARVAAACGVIWPPSSAGTCSRG